MRDPTSQCSSRNSTSHARSRELSWQNEGSGIRFRSRVTGVDIPRLAIRQCIIARYQIRLVAIAGTICARRDGAETVIGEDEVGGEFIVAEREGEVGECQAGK